MFFYCVEPAHDRVGQDYHDWKYTIKQGLGHHIIFPHVDSCLGVICQLTGNRVFAGHINGFYQNDFSAQSHQGAFQAMVNEMQNAQVQRAAIFGDVRAWAGFVQFPWAVRVDIRADSCPNGIDVMFDVDGGGIQVARYVQDRNFRQRPLQNTVWSGNLYGLGAYSLVTC